MITDIGAFLQWFDGVHRRTVRDVSLLPAQAETWTPALSGGDEESGWGIPKLVEHIVEARGYFASAFTGRGWVWDPWPERLESRESWVPALERSAEDLRERLGAVHYDRLREKVELLGVADRKVSAWRLLMMMSEHEIQHRSQIAAYAGLNGWDVAQTFDRTNEWVVAQRDDQVARYRQEERMSPDPSYVEENDRERERMRALVERLSDDDLRRPVNPHWTVAGALGHIAFWDGRNLALAERMQQGVPFSESDDEPEDVDWINDSYRRLIHAVPPRELAELSLQIAEETDAKVASLDPARVWPNDKTPINPLRATHRAEHLDDIETALEG